MSEQAVRMRPPDEPRWQNGEAGSCSVTESRMGEKSSEDAFMETSASRFQIASSPHWVSEVTRRLVIQAIEPEAEHVLCGTGGQILRHHEGYVYEEYVNLDFPTIVLYWPQGTRCVYLRQAGQEDSVVIFMAALLPDGHQELHLTYDYRLCSPFGPLEEFFTLREAEVGIFAEREARHEIDSS